MILHDPVSPRLSWSLRITLLVVALSILPLSAQALWSNETIREPVSKKTSKRPSERNQSSRAKPTTVTQISISLDGKTNVTGTPVNQDSLPFYDSKRSNLPLNTIRFIKRNGDKKTYAVHLRDHTVRNGVLLMESLRLKTASGELSIRVERMSVLSCKHFSTSHPDLKWGYHWMTGLREYARTVRVVDKEFTERVNTLVKALGDDNFFVRSRAMRELQDLGAPAYRILDNVETKDPEVRSRIRKILLKFQRLDEALGYLPLKDVGAQVKYGVMKFKGNPKYDYYEIIQPEGYITFYEFPPLIGKGYRQTFVRNSKTAESGQLPTMFAYGSRIIILSWGAKYEKKPIIKGSIHESQLRLKHDGQWSFRPFQQNGRDIFHFVGLANDQ